jgi:hypothetical protein
VNPTLEDAFVGLLEAAGARAIGGS